MNCCKSNKNKYYNNKIDIEKQGTYNDNNYEQNNTSKKLIEINKNIRLQFIRKVFIILTLQLILTFSIIILFSFVDAISSFCIAYPLLMWIPFTLAMVIYCYIVCKPKFARTHPYNIISLFVFSLFLSIFLGMLSAFYTTMTILFGILFVLVISFSLILFAMQTKIDFTSKFAYLYIILWLTIVFSCIIPFAMDRLGNLIFSFIFGILFSCYIVYDTQLIGKFCYIYIYYMMYVFFCF